ncbi:MAG: CAP domain-containing protein [Deltaproteobacteria bacterium]|nr:CAP domain-containing protein [Deltaproteobacteria bacterium]
MRRPLTYAAMMRSVALAVGALAATGCMVGDPAPPGVAAPPAATGETSDEAPAQDNAQRALISIDDGLDAEERVFLQQINDYRVANALAPLQVSVALTHASEFHATDMATKNYFSHDSQDGTSWSDRIRRYYNYNTYLAENIAAGNAGGVDTFTQWKNSPGHDANMKGASYRVIAIARAYDANATYGWYWVTDFGGYVDEVMTTGMTDPPPPPPPSNLLTGGDFSATQVTSGVPYTSVRDVGTWYSATTNGSVAAAGGVLSVYDALVGNVSVAQLVAAGPGTYTVSANVRWISGGTGQVLYLDFLDASYARIGRASVTPGASATEHAITRTATAPAGTAFARVTIYGYTGNNDYTSTYEWDDLTLTAQ